jgi:hypothetical protein
MPIGAHLEPLLGILLRQAAALPGDERPGLIEGAAGIALTLHSMTAPGTSGWEACLLIS